MIDPSARARLITDILRLTLTSESLATKIAISFAETLHLHPTDSRALSLIFNAETTGHFLTAKELASALNLTAGAVTHSVDRLAAAGFVWRDYDKNDRRRVLHRTTPGGAKVAKQYADPIRQTYERVFDRYTDEELAAHLTIKSDLVEAFTELEKTLK